MNTREALRHARQIRFLSDRLEQALIQRRSDAIRGEFHELLALTQKLKTAIDS